ncbi:helix-turn-helix domain-containing protein [Candidatus Enterococcus leclercqii]|uniref:helix-turn-helix domain-containing protein n=1 Tax=Enterococcus TaxID=1350 RepID=UPI001379CF38|nr:helix-turn-helix domain-containing protein [Enterococcus sp. CU9D]KAF1290098.1 hypothetical protein BAU14_13085 [Enterococcus sp. CU9D]
MKKNQTDNLVSFNLIILAVKGEREAINKVLLKYHSYIQSFCKGYYEGADNYEKYCIDEYMCHQIEAKLVEKILVFKVK